MKGKTLLHFINFFLGFDSIKTQTSKKEQTAMLPYIKNASTIVEIGVFEGYNTREFALHSNDEAIVYAIDPFFKGSLGFNYGKIMAKKEWRDKKIANKIKIIEGFSWDVTNKIPDNIDFIFIDGDHSFEGVKKDFDLYASKLSSNGIIALHDARIFENGWTKPDWGPVRLVEEYIKEENKWHILDEIDSLVLISAAK